MRIDLLKDTLQKGFSLLLDETSLAHSGLLSFLSQHKASLPPHSVVLLQSVGADSNGNLTPGASQLRSILSGSPALVMAGYQKPVTAALTEKGATLALAVLTTDPNKAAIYAGISTKVRHQTVLIRNPFETELVKPTTASQTSISVAHVSSASVPAQFKYFGTSTATPPDKGKQIDTGWAQNETDETGTDFPGSEGNMYKATGLISDKGASGAIYHSQDPNLVIKHFKPGQLYAVEQEKIRMMCASPMNHPNCIWPLEMVSKKARNGKVYKDVGYVMRNCPFPDLDGITKLDKLLDRFPTKEKLVSAIVKICDAFQYMLDANVVNGDIKLTNICYDSKKNEPYIVDFDAVQIDKYINRMATAGYIPPEVYAAAMNAGGTYQFYRKKYSDYYAISVCIFILLLGIAFPYGGGGAADDEAKRDLTFKGNFPFKGTDAQVQANVHVAAYVRWTHLPSFVRQALIDTFDSKGAHYRPDQRYSPGEWKVIMSAYLRMLRDPKSDLAKKDPNYYRETAPLFKPGTKELCAIPLKTLELKMVQEVKETKSALNLDQAVNALIRKMSLSNVNAANVVSALRRGDKFQANADTSFVLSVNLPFLKTVECTTYKPG
ncbi:MAG: serine/threonine-protein kinase [Bacilli bacterium]|nr:serine/threonine-protein kinase [Bacilli bacterium]